MTNRKNSHMVQRGIAQRGFFYALALASLAGCSSVNSILEPGRIDYKSAAKASVPTLAVPPDLTQLQRDNRYAIPQANDGTATASSYNLQQGVQSTPQTAAAVAPKTTPDMHIERDGNQRWLVVKQTPEALWPQLKDFWQESGFLINIDSPEFGVMETDWAENRAKIPQDLIRNTLGKILDPLYSTGERDKFRTRLERGANGTTEIYISHRGAQEVLTGQQKDSTVWTPRPADPELEAEFLARLMVRLGEDDTRAKEMVVSAVPQAVHAKLVKGDNGSYVEVDEGFERAWRRVGLALDRAGFTVEDRDRMQGLYFVRYVDQGKDAQEKATDKGFLSRLFSFSSDDDKAKAAQRYRVSVKDGGDTSRVAVLNNDGRAETSRSAEKILVLLNEQLK
ncbi:MAG TPA: outer membrane protein assembly factor BamC [Burkholderiaceae bacterium]|nr:outer membrane protein assembly factor BamC [Burkholderiaceae bacterium]